MRNQKKSYLAELWEEFHKVIISVILGSLVVGGMTYIMLQKRETDKQGLYFNIELRIVSINSDSSLSNDKFHKPQLCNTVLFETITEPHLYCEINTCDLPKKNGIPTIHINTAWLYNHMAGDIVHFDCLRKDRFFEIKSR